MSVLSYPTAPALTHSVIVTQQPATKGRPSFWQYSSHRYTSSLQFVLHAPLAGLKSSHSQSTPRQSRRILASFFLIAFCSLLLFFLGKLKCLIAMIFFASKSLPRMSTKNLGRVCSRSPFFFLAKQHLQSHHRIFSKECLVHPPARPSVAKSIFLFDVLGTSLDQLCYCVFFSAHRFSP
jgi:hypothetical protein